jgi:predicted transcriptional regulator
MEGLELKLTENQILFLIEIAKQDGKHSISNIGKRVYNTAISIYNNMNILNDYRYITINRRRNMILARLTQKGKDTLDAYYKTKLLTRPQ